MAKWLIIIVILVSGCSKQPDPIDRQMKVFHLVCPEDSFYVYVPVNSMGFVYDANKYRVLSYPAGCSEKMVGIVNDIGDLP